MKTSNQKKEDRMTKTLMDYFPSRTEDADGETGLVQGHVPVPKRRKIAAILKEEHWTWQEFVNGMCDKFLDEYQPKKKKIG